MAKDLNKALIEGNLGRDATANDKSIFFTMASTESYKDKDGEWKDVTTWVPVVYYRSTSEKLVAALTKGTKVRIDGKLASYEREEDGQKRTVVQIVANDITFLPRPNRNNDDDDEADERPRAAKSSGSRRRKYVVEDDDAEGGDDKPW